MFHKGSSGGSRLYGLSAGVREPFKGTRKGTHVRTMTETLRNWGSRGLRVRGTVYKSAFLVLTVPRPKRNLGTKRVPSLV